MTSRRETSQSVKTATGIFAKHKLGLIAEFKLQSLLWQQINFIKKEKMPEGLQLSTQQESKDEKKMEIN